MDQITVQV